MRTIFALILLAIGVVLLAFDQALAAGMCLAAAAFILAARALTKTARGTKEVGKALAHGVEEGLEKADTASFDTAIAKKGCENMADVAGQQTFAGQKKWPFTGDQHQFKFKGSASLGDAFSTLIENFKKAFK